MNTWKYLLITAAMLAAMSCGLETHAQSPQPTPNSAKSSPTLDTRADKTTAPGKAGALACNAGSSSVTTASASQPNQASTQSASKKQTLAGDGACLPGEVIASCAAAVEELRASRSLIDALEIESRSLTERLATEKQTTAILTELNETRRSESEALKNAIAAKDETIAAKDVVIASQDKLVEALKKKKPSPWRRIGDILLGAAAIAILR